MREEEQGAGTREHGPGARSKLELLCTQRPGIVMLDRQPTTTSSVNLRGMVDLPESAVLHA